jgi:hypothetical protein
MDVVISHAAELATILISGVGLRSWRTVMLYAVGAATVREALMFAFGATHQPGHLKAFEAPTAEIAITLPLWTCVYALLLAAASRRSRGAARRAPSGGIPA